MAGPADISDIVDVQAIIAAGEGVSIQSFGDPLFVSEFAANASFPDRVKGYTGTGADMRAQLLADGFAATSAPVRQVAAAMVQNGPPRTIYIGRADPGDLTWEESMQAIWDDATDKQLSLYAFAVDTRDVADIEQIADWAQPQFALFISATNAASVINDQPGNLARNLLAKGYDRTAVIWHDAAVASNYGPAVLRSRTGNFAITTTSGTIKIRIDGGLEQTFTLVANAATLLGSVAGPWAIADGDDLIVTVDLGVTQTIAVALAAATVLSGAAENYNFTPGLNLLVRVNGGTAQPVTFPGTQAFDLGTVTEPYVITPGWQLDVSIDGGAPQSFVFDGTETSAQDVADLINATAVGFTATDVGGAVELRSNRFGSSSEVTVENTSTAGLLLALGLPAGTETGSGFAAFLDIATAAEVAAKINLDTVDCTAADDGGRVRVTSDRIGTSSKIQIVGGTANALLAFNTNEFSGSGDFANGASVSSAEMQAWLTESLFGLTVSVETDQIRLTSKVLGSGSAIKVDASALATTLGLSTTLASGSGDFFNAANASAAEVATKIAASIVGGTASDASSQVLISSLTNGATSTVELTGGTLATKLFSTTSATGTGVDEDYIDSALIGHCITFQLDRPDGQSTWDNAPLVGIFPDRITPNQRARLQTVLKVNTYERRQGRNELHRGMCCFGQTTDSNRFIDQRVTADWGRARLTEAFKRTLNLYAENKRKVPLTSDGIEVFANELRQIGRWGQTNGHWVFDDSTIESISDTGITIPTIAQQLQSDLNNRRIVGFRMQLNFQDAIQAVAGTLQLSVVSSAA